MLYRTMKKTGDDLSVLGFGCMRLPKKGISIDEERAIKQIRYDIDKGVNYIDTAMIYAGSEHLLSSALSDGYRERIKLATKMPPMYVKSREDMDKLLEVQLKTLKTDHIDYYLIHHLASASAWRKLKDLGIADFLDKTKADGRIVNAGFSSHANIDDFKEFVDGYGWDFCQIQYNYMDEKNQAGTEGLRYAASKGLGVIVMEPIRGGNLAKKAPPEVQSVWDEADIKRTPAEWALRWVWDHPEVNVVLSGMNEEAHIDENLRIANEAYPNSLTEKELNLVKRAEAVYRKLTKINCTGCRYCMPCPAGVDIPRCFDLYNTGNNGNAPPKIAYQLVVGGKMDGIKPSYASFCKNCGKCVKICPQHIDIPQNLKTIVGQYETVDARILGTIVGYFMRFDRWRMMRKA